jgi:hypothetical protein
VYSIMAWLTEFECAISWISDNFIVSSCVKQFLPLNKPRPLSY